MLPEAWPAAGRGAAPSPSAFVAIDNGTATCAATLVGRVERRWRLLAAAAVPAGGEPGALVELLLQRVHAADPDLASELGLPEPARGDGSPGVERDTGSLLRLEALGSPARQAVVLAATETARRLLEDDAAAAGWATAGASAERDDPLAMLRLATRPDVAALLVGTADPPSSDERDLLGELVALAAGAAERRPGLPVVLAGGAAGRASSFPLATEIIAVPRPHGDPAADLRAVLAGRRAGPADARQALVAATATLAEVLGLRVELLEVGMSGALRARAEPGAQPGWPARVVAAEVPSAALGLVDDDAALDRVESWATLGLDRARLRDRLAELRLAPWADLGGDGALLRAAALRASLGRLLAATEGDIGGPAPDVVVLAGGTWSAVPAPAALLVLADAVRRPGVVQVALDGTRLLAPLGTVDDPGERADLVRDLVSEALVPLGTLAVAHGVRSGRPAGTLRVVGDGVEVDLELAGGRLALVDLPPGQAGSATFAFRAPVDLGVRGRRFAARVTGGLAGLVVDLRDEPLRLPERSDERRELLARWEAALWPERDR